MSNPNYKNQTDLIISAAMVLIENFGRPSFLDLIRLLREHQVVA